MTFQVSNIRQMKEVQPLVWSIVFELNNKSFGYMTDLLYVKETQTWICTKMIPHELTSLLEQQTCPLCEDDRISCTVASKHHNEIMPSVLASKQFRDNVLASSEDDFSFEQIQYVNNKKEWVQLFNQNQNPE
ncbi:hypothetical protein [Bacillus sp. FJAT-45350]|uniref:hypothetical protein n=1 Tax=Bacillus sp. FJAT-45350 TaxID=2011014 RepID=UPI000BB70EF1|nr:hypothetical protein [Bacillus sp. FJAT-45350]